MAASGSERNDDSGVGWLYKQPGIDRDQYLLGKKIDKAVDPLLASEEREKQALASGPGALFLGQNAAGSTADLATKIKEDPLFLIKKKEEEARQRLASNPVKMKQLKELLVQKKSKRKDRSRSPHKKRHHSHSPSRRHKKSHRHTKRDRSPPHHSRSHSSRLSREELEKRREEMMADAQSHGQDREQRLRRLERDKQREEKETVTSRDSDFLQPMRVQSIAAAGSLEERIHRHIGSVQRTRTALDSNFMK